APRGVWCLLPARTPNGRTPSRGRLRPSSSARVIAPTFDDRASISATVIVSVGRGSASLMFRSQTGSEGASVKDVFGVTTWSVSAAAYVTTLKVEPGSYV